MRIARRRPSDVGDIKSVQTCIKSRRIALDILLLRQGQQLGAVSAALARIQQVDIAYQVTHQPGKLVVRVAGQNTLRVSLRIGINDRQNIFTKIFGVASLELDFQIVKVG